MFYYQAYGLIIGSTLPLPELAADQGRADVQIRQDAIDPPPPAAFQNGRCFKALACDETLLAWKDLVTVKVRAGREITFNASDRVEETWLQQCLLGPALGVLLHQRGLLVLHGSAVAMQEGAVAFIGHKGAGKSTTAAALCGRGYQLLADDIVALDIRGTNEPAVIPGLPQVKLWSDAADTIEAAPAAETPLHPGSQKRIRDMRPYFMRQPLALQQIYVLSTDREGTLEHLSAKASLLELSCHVYAPRFIGRKGMRPACFHQCTQLSQTVPMAHLPRSSSLEEIDDVLDLIEQEPLSQAVSRYTGGPGA